MATRDVQVSKEGRACPLLTQVRGDSRTQIIRLIVDRYSGGVDLSGLAWDVVATNAAGESDIYYIADAQVEDTVIVCDWVVRGIATSVEGETRFELEGFDRDADGETVYTWQSGIYSIDVTAGLNYTPSEDEEAELSGVQELILTVTKELPTVYEARDAANQAATAANNAAAQYEDLDARVKKIEEEGAGGGLPSGGAPYQQLVTDGEGNAKWEDRPYKNVQPVDFLSGEVSLTFGDGRPTTISTTKTFISGQEYTVSWDSVEYKCEAYVAEGPNTPSVGNGAIANVSGGNGEPFFITTHAGELLILAQEDGAHTVRIVGTEIDVRTIDSELMPDGYPKLETKEVSFLSETSVAFEWDASGVGHTSVPCPSGMLEDGKTYAITVNGETHTCKAVRTDYEDDYEISCGKDRTASGEDPTGEPFFIFSNPNWPDELIVRTTNDMLPTPSIFTVVEIEETIQPLDPKYLPAVKIVVDEDSNTYTGNVETYEDFSRHILNGSPVVVHYVSSGKVVEVCNAASVKHTDMPTEWEIYVRRADGEWRNAARYRESVPGIFPGSA